MFVVEVLARVMAGLMIVFAGIYSCIYGFLLVRDLVHLSTSAEVVGTLIGSVLMLLLGVWGSRKLAAMSHARSQ